jgi:hypothetical protein
MGDQNRATWEGLFSINGWYCSFGYSASDALQHVIETWIVPQAVHAWFHMQIDKPVGVLFVGFLQVFDRAIVFLPTRRGFRRRSRVRYTFVSLMLSDHRALAMLPSSYRRAESVL